MNCARPALASILLLVALSLGGCPTSDPGGYPGMPTLPAQRQDYQLSGLNLSLCAGTQAPAAGEAVDDAQISSRLAPLVGHTRAIRTYGVTAGLERIAPLARAQGFEVWAGAWISPNRAANAAELDNLIAIGQAGQAAVLVVGSEVLLRNDLSESELLQCMARARVAAPPAVKVTTADTYAVLLAHPKVLEAFEIVFANIHPFWEGASIDAATGLVDGSWQMLGAAGAGKRVVLSEVGWPSAGSPHGSAVPSPENAARFFQEATTWARARGADLFWFAATDEAWKSNVEGDVGAHWGLWFADGATLKPGMQPVFDGQRSADTWSGSAIPGGPGTPELDFASVPVSGSAQDLTGRIWHAKPADHVVVVYIQVDGAWWIKPTLAKPKTMIAPNGTWVCDVTTGGRDAFASAYAAFLLPAGITPPVALGASKLPPELAGMAVASLQVSRP